MMRRADYIVIAKALAKVRSMVDNTHPEMSGAVALIHVTNELSKALKTDNPNFDAERFWEATHG